MLLLLQQNSRNFYQTKIQIYVIMKCNRILKAIQFYHKIDVIEEKGKKILKSKTKKKNAL